MRIAAMLVVAAVGCSTPVGGPPDDALPFTTVGEDPPAPERSAPEPTPLTSALQQEAISLEIPTRLSWSGADVSSTFTDRDGSVFSTGTFSGAIVVEGHVLRSKGDTDVFLAKFLPTGHLEWVLAVGSPERDHDPRITGVDQDRVLVIGLTEGRMDCGTGPLVTWSSATFFACSFRTTDGLPQTAGTFPTGEP